jgi:hypothetical protein
MMVPHLANFAVNPAGEIARESSVEFERRHFDQARRGQHSILLADASDQIFNESLAWLALHGGGRDSDCKANDFRVAVFTDEFANLRRSFGASM